MVVYQQVLTQVGVWQMLGTTGLQAFKEFSMLLERLQRKALILQKHETFMLSDKLNFYGYFNQQF